MLVATSVATDARVLKEARTLIDAGHRVHVIGKSVPSDFVPPPGMSVSSVGASSVLRKEGAPSLAARRLPPHLRLARWALLPLHRNSTFTRWAREAERLAAGIPADVVHAHDFTALEAGHRVATAKGVPLVYDSHELWSGRSREYRPTPLQDARERAVEARLGGQAAAVITVGDGVAEALRRRYGWSDIAVVRNSFPRQEHARPLPQRPRAVVYAGRLGAHRELEVVGAASRRIAEELDLEVRLMGPGDDTWLRTFDRGVAQVSPPCPPDEVDDHLREAGIVLVTLQPGWENHRLALPNKLFHAVRAGVPLVATDLGELAATVRTHGIGRLYRPGSADDLVRAVGEVVADYPALCEAVATAAADLTWERDASVLLEVYARLERDATTPAAPAPVVAPEPPAPPVA